MNDALRKHIISRLPLWRSVSLFMFILLITPEAELDVDDEVLLAFQTYINKGFISFFCAFIPLAFYVLTSRIQSSKYWLWIDLAIVFLGALIYAIKSVDFFQSIFSNFT